MEWCRSALFFFFSSRRRHTRSDRDWSSDVCSSDLALAARLPDAALVDGDGGISAAVQAGRLPVLAPYHWLRAADPLPHSWEVTSDPIAAWLAGQLGARRVVLIKPAHALDSKTIVDSYFLRTLPHGVEHLIVTADDLGQLDVALREDPPPDRDLKRGRRFG